MRVVVMTVYLENWNYFSIFSSLPFRFLANYFQFIIEGLGYTSTYA